MKTLIATALVATIAAGSASAMGTVSGAQEKLDTYGFSVDAGTLSNAQVNALNFIKVDSDLERPRTADARIINKIRAILN